MYSIMNFMIGLQLFHIKVIKGFNNENYFWIYKLNVLSSILLWVWLMVKPNYLLIYTTGIFTFVALWLSLYSDNELARSVFSVFVEEFPALYMLCFTLILFIIAFVLQKFYNLGSSALMFFLLIIWLCNIVIVMNLGSEMPIHIIFTAPFGYFSTIHLITKYIYSLRNRFC